MSSAKSSEAVQAMDSDKSSEVSETILWSSEEWSDSSSEGTVKSLLDFKSPQFSPVLALKCSTSEVVSVEDTAKKYLNLQQYSKAVKSPSKSPRKDVSHVKKMCVEDLKKTEEVVVASMSSAKPQSSAATDFPIPGRRFLPHQLPVFRPRKEHPNTLTLMATVEGPLSVLNRVMKEKVRIKIWTRSDKGFRGFLTGFVGAFDKHWNIGLLDVDEQFVRKRVIKFPALGESLEETGESSDNSAAISAAFMRLKNYLRQNDINKRAIAVVKGTKTTARNKKGNSSSTVVEVPKSKTVYLGDMDPLNLCRTGLASLSLRNDVAVKSTPTMKPDIVQCHRSIGKAVKEEASVPATQRIQQNISRTSIKKKSLTVFKTPRIDSFGFAVVAQTRKYELVERHVGQVLLMGNDIVFIETSGC